MKVAGTAFFLIDGIRFSAKGNFSAALTDIERESVMGLDGYHGFKEMHVPVFIEGDITDKSDIDIDALNRADNATVTIELANGKTGVMRNAVQINQLALGVDEGEITLRFEGPNGEWINP